jgi:hypothetical protein
MKKIQYIREHELGFFNIYNPDYTCLGMMTDGLAVFVYKELEDSYQQFEVIDVNRPLKHDLTQMRRVFELEVTLSECNAWIVTMSRIDREYRGHGLAPHIYRWLLQKTDMILQAGDEQSAGGRSIWHGLAGMDDVLVYGKTHATELTRCEQDDIEREIVACDGTDVYNGVDYFTAFACYSPQRKRI